MNFWKKEPRYDREPDATRTLLIAAVLLLALVAGVVLIIRGLL